MSRTDGRSGLVSKVRAVWRLSWADRLVLVEALCLLPAITCGVRVAGVQGVHRTLGRLSSRPVRLPAATGSDDRPAEIARLVAAASRQIGLDSTCLHRSLALWWLLRRRSFDVSFELGARRTGGMLEAHAWVEQAGVAIENPDAGAGDYVRLPWLSPNRDA